MHCRRISQILINLLGNAAKYSNRGTEVQLVVRESAKENNLASIYFAVIDQGVGISEEDRQRIFGVFEQLGNASSHRQGSGLGLSNGNYEGIFREFGMPVLNGLEATHLIRTSGHLDSGTIPIIAVSANAFDEDISRSLASGMKAHLSK